MLFVHSFANVSSVIYYIVNEYQSGIKVCSTLIIVSVFRLITESIIMLVFRCGHCQFQTGNDDNLVKHVKNDHAWIDNKYDIAANEEEIETSIDSEVGAEEDEEEESEVNSENNLSQHFETHIKYIEDRR